MTDTPAVPRMICASSAWTLRHTCRLSCCATSRRMPPRGTHSPATFTAFGSFTGTAEIEQLPPKAPHA
jgi:hypothetical protein